MKSEILTVILLVIITDRSGLVSSDRSNIVHDLVNVTIFTSVTTMSVEASSYPSISAQDYPRLCDIMIYSTSTGGGRDCHSPLPMFEECTVMYYEEENCNISLFQLTEQVRGRSGRAVIYRTVDIDDYLRRLDTTNVTGISVILVKDELYKIRSFSDEVSVQVNITVIRPPAENGSDKNRTKFYVVLFVFIVLLLLVTVLVVSVVIVMSYRRHRHRTRQLHNAPELSLTQAVDLVSLDENDENYGVDDMLVESDNK